MKKTYIVYQLQIDEECESIFMSTTVRQVKAHSKEEAIGKFIIGTSDIKAEKKFNVFCIELKNLMSL